MSFDLTVWSDESRITASRAGQIYERLCRGERPSELEPDPDIGGFYRDLTSRWPEERGKNSPWASPPNRSDAHVFMSCVWEKAEEMYSFIQQLAQEHQLALYDPQSDELYAPEPLS